LDNPSNEISPNNNSQSITFLFVIAGIVIGYFVDSLVVEVCANRHWENPVVLGVLSASTAAAVVVAGASFFVLLRNVRATDFTDEVVSELRKVAWPSRDETVNNTLIVIGATVFFSILLAFYDFAWAKLTGLFLYSGA